MDVHLARRSYHAVFFVAVYFLDPSSSSVKQESRLGPANWAVGGWWGNKGKHLSNLQRVHWYVEWTLVCGLRPRLFSRENNLLPLRAEVWANTSSQATLLYGVTAIVLLLPPPHAATVASSIFGRAASTLWVAGGR